MELIPTKRFEKSLRALGPELRLRAAKSMKMLMEDTANRHLNFEKLIVTGLYTIKVDMNFRIILRKIDGNTYELVDILDHHKTYNKYNAK